MIRHNYQATRKGLAAAIEHPGADEDARAHLRRLERELGEASAAACEAFAIIRRMKVAPELEPFVQAEAEASAIEEFFVEARRSWAATGAVPKLGLVVRHGCEIWRGEPPSFATTGETMGWLHGRHPHEADMLACTWSGSCAHGHVVPVVVFLRADLSGGQVRHGCDGQIEREGVFGRDAASPEIGELASLPWASIWSLALH